MESTNNRFHRIAGFERINRRLHINVCRRNKAYSERSLTSKMYRTIQSPCPNLLPAHVPVPAAGLKMGAGSGISEHSLDP